jgi:hypothetical protein
MPAEVGMAACFIHGGTFQFNPYKVAAVLVDPVTGKPPDVDPDPATPDFDVRVARSVQRFICVPCCRDVNREAGYEKIAILDDGAQIIELNER